MGLVVVLTMMMMMMMMAVVLIIMLSGILPLTVISICRVILTAGLRFFTVAALTDSLEHDGTKGDDAAILLNITI